MRLLVFGVLFLGAGALAQLAPQSPQAAYDGQNVSSVSLIGNPRRNPEPLFPLVSQKAGEPYSQEKIQATAEKLKQAGNFSKVEITVEPEVTGLRVNFLLEPAYYVGVVAFPAVGKYFSYTRLLQVANLPDEDPYDPSRMPVAEKALTEFLHRNGYFQAKIHAEPEIDDSHQIVNVKFVGEIGKQARISSVRLDGTDPSESSRLLRAVESLRARLSGGLLKPGKPYSPARISAASALMKRSLRQQHRLAESIHENPPQYDAETNQVEVSFAIKVGPVVDVRTAGAKLGFISLLANREMKKLIPTYSEGAIDQDLVEEGRRNLADYFQKKGYYDVKVTADFQEQPDQITLVYQIDRGLKRKVGRISFVGNHTISADQLAQQITVKKSHLWTHGSLSQKLLKQSAENIQALYRDRGYEEVKVNSRTANQESKIDIAFEVEEGAPTIVEDVQVSGNQNVATAQLAAPGGFLIRAGAPYSPRKLADDRNRISANYLDRGYLNAEVLTKAKKNPGRSASRQC